MHVQDLIAIAGGIPSLARKLGVSLPTIYDWRDSGHIPGARVVQVATALGVSVVDVARLVKPAPVWRAGWHNRNI